MLTYWPLKAVDREFIYKIFARNPRDPQIGLFYFFIWVLGPGRILDGFVPHFSCRYTPSDPNFIIPDPTPSNFVKIPKIKNVVANTFRTIFEKTPLAR